MGGGRSQGLLLQIPAKIILKILSIPLDFWRLCPLGHGSLYSFVIDTAAAAFLQSKTTFPFFLDDFFIILNLYNKPKKAP